MGVDWSIRDAELKRLMPELSKRKMSIRDIAKVMGLSWGSVNNRIYRINHGIKPAKSPIPKADVFRLRNLGYSHREIAEQLGFTQGAVCNILRIRNPVSSTQDAPREGLPVSLQAGPVACPPSPHMSSGRITPEVSLRAAQTTHLRKTAKPRGVPIGPPPKHCQYPEGDRPYTFCLKPVAPERPYCAEHTSLCYVKLKPLMLVPRQPKETFADLKW